MNVPDHEALPATAAFDRELELDELLAAVDPALLKRLFEDFLPGSALLAPDGRVLAGTAQAGGEERIPVRYELAPLAQITCPVALARQAGSVAAILEQVLRMAARYLMASDLHLRAVREDYLALQAKHAELQVSEGRYRELAENLELRVREQVETIEERQRQLFQSERLASVGRLAAGMAHEINNPIGFMASNLRTAGRYLTALEEDGDPEVRRELMEDFSAILAECEQGTTRIAAIVRDLKTFSNVDGSEMGEIDVANLMENARKMADMLAGGQVAFTLRTVPLPPMRARLAELSQALLNVLLNAAQATPEGGVVAMEVGSGDDGVRIEVKDTGIGMTPEVLQNAFDAFFTTRDVGEGAGLGLTVARDVVQAHGGRIAIESHPGKGTTVTMVLPIDAGHRHPNQPPGME
jgi:signal transduction histidine kinase